MSPSKLIELRRKTDRELPEMIERELERALTLASVAATSSSPLRKQADTIYSRMRVLLPVVDSISPAERSRLESKLDELRAALDYPSGKGIVRRMEMVSGAVVK